MPPGVPYIIGNEAAERFSYYGMNGILTIFMTKYLLDKMGNLAVMPPHQAEGWYHTFVSTLYILPIIGAFLADALFGKFWVVFWLSIVYCGGHATLALIGSPVAHTIEPRILLAIGLFQIALGAGGIKPCVSTNVGDQFGESNKHLLTRLFNWFYFSINAGSAISTLLIPWLLEPYSADPNGLIAKMGPSVVSFLENPRLHSPDIAFGLPGIFMAIATVIFWRGRKKFVHIPPAGLGNYARALFNRETGKILLNILIPVPFVAIFWALWQQNFSSWIVQAESMDRRLFGIDRESDFHFDYAAALFLLAVPVRRKARHQANPAAKNRGGIVCDRGVIFHCCHDSNAHRRRSAPGHHLADLGVRSLDRRRDTGLADTPRIFLHAGAGETQITLHVHIFARGFTGQSIHRRGRFLHSKSRRHRKATRRELFHVFRVGPVRDSGAISHRDALLQRSHLFAGPGRSLDG